MAIVVQEDKPQVNWVAILTTLLIVISMFVGGYYLFFKKPKTIEVILPKELLALEDYYKIKDFNPKPSIDTLTKQFKRHATDVPLAPAGRENPFQPF
ncbi:hypothetical protein HY967_00870 [Candidatus Jorgensenbacteria bacterium]|nr:hypothetical protein [Candidatus Jorgensenbacteria bacterium]